MRAACRKAVVAPLIVTAGKAERSIKKVVIEYELGCTIPIAMPSFLCSKGDREIPGLMKVGSIVLDD
ncbi:unnamed protein product [Litomosoides sigmodontis]|uniref:Uncharacterized protein n=1 Tax=Litomosoides sigmodontis TaxID=42156 RepID=A0A3P6S4D4_LITSI|nr:unnamed protein product [Litomosoides sigmodontis]